MDLEVVYCREGSENGTESQTGFDPVHATAGKASSLSPGCACKGKLSALVCSCILSQTCSQLIWDVISFFFKNRNPNKLKPIIFPQQEQQDGGFPAPSLAPDAVPSPAP